MTEKLITSAFRDRQHAHAYLRFHERLANNGKNNDFYKGTTIWCPHVQISLNLENRYLDHRNLHSMLKIS